MWKKKVTVYERMHARRSTYIYSYIRPVRAPVRNLSYIHIHRKIIIPLNDVNRRNRLQLFDRCREDAKLCLALLRVLFLWVQRCFLYLQSHKSWCLKVSLMIQANRDSLSRKPGTRKASKMTDITKRIIVEQMHKQIALLLCLVLRPVRIFTTLVALAISTPTRFY